MYGFTIVDYTKNQTIHVHCTFNESEFTQHVLYETYPLE